MHYPAPSYSAYVWSFGDVLHLAFPPVTEHDRGHSVKLECNLATIKSLMADTERLDLDERKSLRSLYVMLMTLKEREHARDAMSVGKKSSPVQYDLEQIMKNFQGEVKRVGKPKIADENLSLEDLGL